MTQHNSVQKAAYKVARFPENKLAVLVLKNEWLRLKAQAKFKPLIR